MAGSLLGKVSGYAAALALAAYAGVAAFSGWDRLSIVNPDVRAPVGWPYDTFSARALAGDANAAARPKDALPLAQRALLSDPVDASTVGLLGAAHFLAGQADAADAAFRLSAGMGWRDLPTQIYWFNHGLDTGQADVAAQRLDAYLRQVQDDDRTQTMLNDMVASPEGRAAIVPRLAETPSWQRMFLSAPSTMAQDDFANRYAVLRQLRAGSLGCPAVSSFTTGLMRTGLMKEAQDIWNRECEPGNALVHDGQFVRINPDPNAHNSVFDWQVPSSGTVELLVTDLTNGAHQLDLRVSGASPYSVLRQVVVLPAGAYRLSWAMPGTTATELRALKVGLGCTFDQGIAQDPVPQAGGRVATQYVLDDTCQARALVFWLAPGTQVHIADVRLERLPG